jgi:peroxiredoxin
MDLRTPAPAFTLPSATGEEVSLSGAVKNGNVLLVFLRHLG